MIVAQNASGGPIDFQLDGGNYWVSISASNWNSSSISIDYVDELGVTHSSLIVATSDTFNTSFSGAPGNYILNLHSVTGLSIAFRKVPA